MALHLKMRFRANTINKFNGKTSNLDLLYDQEFFVDAFLNSLESVFYEPLEVDQPFLLWKFVSSAGWGGQKKTAMFTD